MPYRSGSCESPEAMGAFFVVVERESRDLAFRGVVVLFCLATSMGSSSTFWSTLLRLCSVVRSWARARVDPPVHPAWRPMLRAVNVRDLSSTSFAFRPDGSRIRRHVVVRLCRRRTSSSLLPNFLSQLLMATLAFLSFPLSSSLCPSGSLRR